MSRSIKPLLLTFLLLGVGYGRPPGPKIECVAACGEGTAGAKTAATVIEPFGVAFDKAGNGYICEYKGQKITRLAANGTLHPWAGTGKLSFAGDGGPAASAGFNDPHGLVISRQQQMYVADTLNHRVRKIDLKSGTVATIAGTGDAGFSGDGGAPLQAAFNGIYAVDVNRTGDKIYVADLGNRRIRMIDLKARIVSTVAGNGQNAIPEDGAEAARSPLVDPRAVAVDSKGNLYILERRGNALRVVDNRGKIRTVIGPTASDNPPMQPKLNGPKHICVDREDNVIIADAENHLIRKYSPKDGTTVTIAGTGEKGARVAPEDPLRTQLNRPHGVYVHPSGSLYISDSYNHRILKMTSR